MGNGKVDRHRPELLLAATHLTGGRTEMGNKGEPTPKNLEATVPGALWYRHCRLTNLYTLTHTLTNN